MRYTAVTLHQFVSFYQLMVARAAEGAQGLNDKQLNKKLNKVVESLEDVGSYLKGRLEKA